MQFGIHSPSWPLGPDPAEIFESVKAGAQRAKNNGFTWFSVMDHLIQIPHVGAPDEPFMEGWTVLARLAAGDQQDPSGNTCCLPMRPPSRPNANACPCLRTTTASLAPSLR